MTMLRELTDDVVVEPNNEQSILRPQFMSHGTMECRDFNKSRPFYEQFLGLECVQHGRRSIAVRCGMKFHIVCLQVGDALQSLGVNTHWGLDLRSREEVEAAHRSALEHQERFGIRRVTDVVDAHGVYSFYIEDVDSNWWEPQFYEAGFQNEDMFDFGDRFTPDGKAIDA
jgi:catechol 2,3-dioxygenase-like lactoylglutathione lyase family enzyme